MKIKANAILLSLLALVIVGSVLHMELTYPQWYIRSGQGVIAEVFGTPWGLATIFVAGLYFGLKWLVDTFGKGKVMIGLVVFWLLLLLSILQTGRDFGLIP